MSRLAEPTAARRARRRATALLGPAEERRGRSWLEKRIADLALPVDPASAAAAMPAAVLLATLVSLALLGPIGAALLLAVAATAIGSLHRGAPRRRADAAERALPGLLESVARQLRAGATLAQAIPATAPPDGVTELRRSWGRLGDLIPAVGVTAALGRWTTESPTGVVRSPSVRLAAAALSLASSTGGSPARAIDGVAATLRSRMAVADEVRALSTQARASAVVIAAAPVVFGVMAGVTDPRTRAFLASPPGLVLLALGLGLDALGGWWMARLCRSAGVG